MKYMLKRKKTPAAICLLAIIQGLLCVLTACSAEERYTDKRETGYGSWTEAAAVSESQAQPATQVQTEEAPGPDQSDAEYDEIKTWSWAPYETLYRTDGTRMGLVQEADGTRHIGEVPDTKVWIWLKDGTLLSDEPFDVCIDYMGTPEGEVYCIRNGTGYRYTVSAGDGSFQLSEVDEPETLEEDQFGYRLCVTRWDSREPCYGIVTADGTEVIAPVYVYPSPSVSELYQSTHFPSAVRSVHASRLPPLLASPPARTVMCIA